MRSAAPLALVCLLVAAPGAAALWPFGWHDVALIDEARADPAKGFEAFDAASLNLYDIDRDGQLEIVSLNDNNRAYVIDARTGKVAAELDTTRFGGDAWPARDINPIAIGDLRGDGGACVVVPSSGAFIAAWCYRGPGLFGQLRFEKVWEVRANASVYEKDFAARHPWLPKDAAPGMDGNAFLANVDGDPALEVFAESDGYPGQFSFDDDGSYRWSRSDWDGNAGAQVTDLDGDGAKEALFASDAGVVAVYDAASGKLEWTFDAAKAGATPGSIPVAPLVADLDGDGKREVFFGARHAVEGPGDWRNASHAVYFLLDHAGKQRWRLSEPWMNPLTYNHAAPVDVDGDGDLDIVTLDWNTVGHKPGNWEPTGRPSNLFALDARTGKTLWRQSVDVFWSNKDLVVADIVGDGGMEVVLNEASGGRDGLGVRDLRTGARVAWHPLPEGWQAMRGPVAGDVYGDGRVILVVPVARPDPAPSPHRALDVGHRDGALLVVDTGSRGAVAFSANFLHAEAAPRAPVADLGWKALAVGAAAAAGLALGALGRRRERAPA